MVGIFIPTQLEIFILTHLGIFTPTKLGKSKPTLTGAFLEDGAGVIPPFYST